MPVQIFQEDGVAFQEDGVAADSVACVFRLLENLPFEDMEEDCTLKSM